LKVFQSINAKTKKEQIVIRRFEKLFFFLKLNGSLILDFGKIFPNNTIRHQKVFNKNVNAEIKIFLLFLFEA
jgi:hypothetical protein